MKRLSFLLQFIRNPHNTGAILPSSTFLARKMVESIHFEQAKYIIEYGPGTGVFTQQLLQRRRPDTILLLIKNNLAFYHQLKNKYQAEKNLFIVHGSAENITQYLADYQIPYADFILSGLPFASLPKEVSARILTCTRQVLQPNGAFITFQYTKCKKKFIEQFFSKVTIQRELRNLPPAYILKCCIVKEETEGCKNVENTCSR